MKHWLINHWLTMEQAVAECEAGDIIELENGQQCEVLRKRGPKLTEIDIKVIRGPVQGKIGAMGIG